MLAVAHRPLRDQGEAGALHELLVATHPGARRREGMRGGTEEVAADLVADVPRIEVGGPGVHLRRRHLRRVVDHRGDDAGLVDPGGPQVERERVIEPVRLRDPAAVRDAHAQGSVDGDPDPRHAGRPGGIRGRTELVDHAARGRLHARDRPPATGSSASSRIEVGGLMDPSLRPVSRSAPGSRRTGTRGGGDRGSGQGGPRSCAGRRHLRRAAGRSSPAGPCGGRSRRSASVIHP